MPSCLNTFQVALPPAPMTQRFLAAVCDLILVFFLSLLIVGKIWMPIYHADALMQFRILLEYYVAQLSLGQFSEFFIQIKNNTAILQMFQSIEHVLFVTTWGYYAVNAYFFEGGTLGKQIFNLRVLKLPNLKSLSMLESIMRAGIFAFFLLVAWPFLPGINLCFMSINKLHRGFHDKLCQTYVVSYSILEQIQGNIREAVRSAVSDDQKR